MPGRRPVRPQRRGAARCALCSPRLAHSNIKQSLESVRANAAWLERSRKDVLAWCKAEKLM